MSSVSHFVDCDRERTRTASLRLIRRLMDELRGIPFAIVIVVMIVIIGLFGFAARQCEPGSQIEPEEQV